jgi:glycosyltransferase involved in cell wall biosynthesis
MNMPKKRLLILLQEYPQISETYIKNELEVLATEFELEILAMLPANAPYRDRFPCLYLTQNNQANVVEYLRRWKPQAIHSHYMKMLPLAFKFASLFNIPFTVRAHSFDVLDGYLATLDKQIFQSEHLKGILCFPPFADNLMRAGMPASKIVPANPVIDVRKFFTGKAADAQAVMNVGAALPKKNMDEYIELSKLMPETVFRLYGLGYDTATLKAKNAQWGGRVEFVPPVEPEHMPAQYQRHRWLVYTASKSMATVGWPMAIAEAQASGLGVAMQNIRPDLRDYCGPSVIMFDHVSELVGVVDNPPSDEHLEKGFQNSRRFDFQNQMPMLTALWN